MEDILAKAQRLIEEAKTVNTGSSFKKADSGRKAKDLTGLRFNDLSVLSPGPRIVEPDGTNRTAWLCLCKCGTKKNIKGKDLLTGNVKSCGCRILESKYAQLVDLTGKRFGKLVVLRLEDRNHKATSNTKRARSKWLCQCDCGRKHVCNGESLRSGNTKSCGQGGICSPVYKHGCSGTGYSSTYTKEYHLWRGMISRCNSTSAKAFKHYGGRGIKVCERWLDFNNFIADLGKMPPGYSLDRIDTNGDYEPNNCRWVDWATQAANKRPRISRYLAFDLALALEKYDPNHALIEQLKSLTGNEWDKYKNSKLD